MRTIAAALTALICGVVLLGGALLGDAQDAQAVTGQALDVEALPEAARDSLGDLEAARDTACPELPLVWLVAEVQAESSWNPHAYSPAGAAGLLQLMPSTWVDGGGGDGWDVAGGPRDDHPVWTPRTHFAVALPWMCRNLRTMTEHLQATGKALSPLDALAVCHIAGCFRVTGSATGIPTPGEAGCGAQCVREVTDYLDAIHGYVEQYTAAPALTAAGAAAAFPGGASGCTVPDPTGTGGCVTPATAWMLAQFRTTFGKRSTSCWDAHAWNPTSDHPKGKGCDIFYGTPGKFPGQEDVALGWQAAIWLQTNADALRVSYVIWQGRIWSRARSDEGWRAYTGGGVYDAQDATGGHYDHIHVSMAE
ncbi:lytic transglycosylase domain-containing protein [Paenibacillus sp. TRM 82003]|uniref:transglycosylase SLT domain-containing protein n=1 Tax=Kineococcus sp. TRM81007 TaxID=2925831 RepID=UPI001F5A729A|nr:transglycosylase SLT domain-containing protein [Kineococcus sp. TRM81007]MCI2238082.1 lytic transglycosylase domain-containing protein [Kineococcus sp. TRM81007]MCI3920466.1 lytic transglycosylase domain-containing protein [Paenibacillus sp. TRM 82003]